ncbi:MAG TPA: STAS/SEC14 domain-containing protein [Chthoniobacter sp.]|nr:STAS/SEC14 domain-containing protein [Chthoniobacter sp.]
MPVTIQLEPNNVYVLRSSGMLKSSEFGTVQASAARAIDAGAQPRMLAILEDFQGWEKGADWNDLDFQLSHGNQIARIAIVGEPRWESEALAFAGAGFRRAPVKFFPPSQLAEARAWLEE